MLDSKKDQYRTVRITICYYKGGRDITLQELVVMEGGQGRSHWPGRHFSRVSTELSGLPGMLLWVDSPQSIVSRISTY